jgi:uncharacterized protein YvpB
MSTSLLGVDIMLFKRPIKWLLSLVVMAGCAPAATGTQQEAPEESAAEHYTIQSGQTPKQQKEKKKLTGKKASTNRKAPPVKGSQKILIDAPHIKQTPELARGCEVTSLAMLLNFAGVSVDKMTLAKEVKKVPFEENGLRGSLNDGFVGNMETMDKPGIGVYHGPVNDLAEKYLPGRVLEMTGENFESIISQLDKKKPVWVIVTSTFDIVPEKEWETWKTASGPLRITYKMHAVLVTGYSQNFIYVNDPLTQKNRKLARKPFIAGWEQLGRQAISLK